MSRRVSVTVDVDVWLDDIDTEDLREELKSRHAADPSPLQEIAQAFKLGMTERAVDLTRTYLSNELGVIL